MILRTCKIVIKQGFDNVSSEIDVNTIVLLAAGHFSGEKMSRSQETQGGSAYTVFSGSIQSTSIEASWSGLTIV